MTTEERGLQAAPRGFLSEPQNYEQAWQIANTIAASEIVPKAYQGRPDNVLVAMQMGAEVGLAPMQAIQNIAVINGRPAVWGDGVAALCKGHRDFVDMEETYNDETHTAICRVKRRGCADVVQTFSAHDAELAGLLKKAGPWQQYPRRMMQMRARSFALRDAFPDALRGIQTVEEIRDIPPEREISGEVIEDAPEPKSGKAKLRAKISAGGLDRSAAVFSAIEAATTPEGLTDAVKDADSLPDWAKEKARALYVERKAAIAGATFEGVSEAMNKAGNMEALQNTLEQLAMVPDESQRDELMALFDARAEAITGAA